MARLVTLDEVREWLGEEGLTADAQLISIVDGASAAIEAAIGQSIVTVTITGEYHDGDGTDLLYPKYHPVTKITEVVISSVKVTDCELADAISIFRRSGFPRGRRNIVIKYDAGYAAVPDDIRLACLMLVKFYTTSQLTARSMWFEGGGGVGPEREWPEQVRMIVDAHRTIGVG